MPTKNQIQLLSALGPEYSIKTIDLEECVYRKINDCYDIEVSGTWKKGLPITIYVWRICGGKHTVEQIDGIKSTARLKHELDKIIEKYSDLA